MLSLLGFVVPHHVPARPRAEGGVRASLPAVAAGAEPRHDIGVHPALAVRLHDLRTTSMAERARANSSSVDTLASGVEGDASVNGSFLFWGWAYVS